MATIKRLEKTGKDPAAVELKKNTYQPPRFSNWEVFRVFFVGSCAFWVFNFFALPFLAVFAYVVYFIFITVVSSG